MAVQRKLMTAEEFEAFTLLPENVDRIFEFIDGEIFELPSNPYSSEIASMLIRFLGNYVYPNNLGRVTGENGGYIVAGSRMAPDVAFIRRDRQDQLARQGYNPIAPDLAVEVISPTDKAEDTDKKLKKYAEAEVLVWVVYPETQTVVVHTPGKAKQTLGIEGILDGGDVLLGFTIAIREIFP